MTDTVVAFLILLPIAVTFFLKSSAVQAILALAAGYMVVNLVGTDINNGLASINLNGLSTVDVYSILLILPPLLTLVLTARSWTGRSKMVVQLLAALALGGTWAVTAMPYLNQSLGLSLHSSKIWPQLQHIQSGLVGFAMFYALVFLWIGKKNRPHGKHK
jgi:hypothetical protein